jgi:hypothetical protein
VLVTFTTYFHKLKAKQKFCRHNVVALHTKKLKIKKKTLYKTHIFFKDPLPYIISEHYTVQQLENGTDAGKK